MKGSLNLKIDLGWAASVAVLVGLLFFAFTRIALARDIANQLDTLCYREALVSSILWERPQLEEVYYRQCLAELNPDKVTLVFNTNVWSFSDAFPNAKNIFFVLREPIESDKIISDFLEKKEKRN
ncbi:hypothetical protein AVV29_gp038 [Vibrio phage phi 3]|uniref:DUF4359 domain-containing protein n=1 Tax=Vibrio phage phi 3 TaxID=1589298 RepID=A0A0B5GYN1_9CAUD|nr:hypothetical protein AVV29_gp038 [Vibrio phage phi 3]AJF40806.1 hypothetical protein SBVP3_0038 [Vibrio phage phi 3]